MQLMWLSGPTGNVKTISITTRTVLTAAVAVGMFLVTAGFLLHFIGFKIAVEYNPTWPAASVVSPPRPSNGAWSRSTAITCPNSANPCKPR